jgi:hypothetical protein
LEYSQPKQQVHSEKQFVRSGNKTMQPPSQNAERRYRRVKFHNPDIQTNNSASEEHLSIMGTAAQPSSITPAMKRTRVKRTRISIMTGMTIGNPYTNT